MFPWNLFPFNNQMKNMTEQINPNNIEGYIQDMMSKMFPQHMEGMNQQTPPNPFFNQNSNTSSSNKKSPLDSSVFETHEYVYAMVPIKNEEWLRKLKLFYTSNQLIIEHIPDDRDKQIITLPAIVKRKGATAQYKDGLLEVRIPKNIDMQFSEIDVTEVL
ncbi:Hsp20/alpha crystallin family protein [Bacillus sp. 31A1R]|uniref:Hsp20/alpha crystallin family protein n=1 Tax=Robertmurraya mangrovi TaxID=3098077 RepID=A0ABU5J5M0_9BACI|nr:Hsp20/alpha crystallin family protein [Bacillus sp. 31A1R]MDZ5474631.1 Hsp20/alpha crystallin family protein [Bacillus sp. 31A1R]